MNEKNTTDDTQFITAVPAGARIYSQDLRGN
jgi:hypothetical protein